MYRKLRCMFLLLCCVCCGGCAITETIATSLNEKVVIVRHKSRGFLFKITVVDMNNPLPKFELLCGEDEIQYTTIPPDVNAGEIIKALDTLNRNETTLSVNTDGIRFSDK